jgi:hypothetical protein
MINPKLGHLRESNSLAGLPASIVNRYKKGTAAKGAASLVPTTLLARVALNHLEDCSQTILPWSPSAYFPRPGTRVGAVAQGKTGSFPAAE